MKSKECSHGSILLQPTKYLPRQDSLTSRETQSDRHIRTYVEPAHAERELGPSSVTPTLEPRLPVGLRLTR